MEIGKHIQDFHNKRKMNIARHFKTGEVENLSKIIQKSDAFSEEIGEDIQGKEVSEEDPKDGVDVL